MRLSDVTMRLGGNAGVFSALLRDVTAEQAIWKPAPTKWSLIEVINHLADEEAEDFRRRLDLTLHAPEQQWPAIDPEGWVTSRNYAARPLAESLARFLDERRASLEWLATLESPKWDHAHVHPQHGPIRAGDLLASWLEHDFLHIRQLLTLQREFHRHRAAEYHTRYAGDW